MDELTLEECMEPVFTASWPKPRQGWHKSAKQFVGVYGLQWENHMYVGMTVSTNGFQGRWAAHLRTLFIRKRANATTKKIRDFIKLHELTPEDFQLHALQAWPNPKEELTLELTHEIAAQEQKIYDAIEEFGFIMLNNVRPRGTGYVKAARKKRRRRRGAPQQKASALEPTFDRK